MSALILLAVVLALVAIGAPLLRRGLRSREHTITFTISPDVIAALRAFAAAGVTAQQAAERMRAAFEHLGRDAHR